MTDDTPIAFYSSKFRLVHLALNIALSPILLYLFGIWPWPPGLIHLGVFAITGLIGLRYATSRWHRPRLVFDEQGLHYDKIYPKENIRNVKPFMRSLKLSLISEAGPSEKVINLGWASNDDFTKIVEAATKRFGQ